jgi:hypothetical protein
VFVWSYTESNVNCFGGSEAEEEGLEMEIEPAAPSHRTIAARPSFTSFPNSGRHRTTTF